MRTSFDYAAEFYDKTRNLPKQVMKQLVDTMIRELEGHTNVLDAGVGTGRIAKPLQDVGLKIVGVDIAGKMIGKAEGKGVDNLILGDVCSLPLCDNSFDATISVHLLHLICEWKTALQEICRVTEKIMISVDHVRKHPLREAYRHLLREFGFEIRYPGKGEWELKNLVKPKQVSVASFERNADERLEYMSQRAYSSQWEIPEEVNREVVRELKHRFGGKKFPEELHILVWEISELESCLSITAPNMP